MEAEAFFNLELDPLIDRLLLLACEMTGAADAALYIQNGNPNQLYKRGCTSSSHIEKLPLRLDISENRVIGSTFTSGKTKSYSAKSRKMLSASGFDAALCTTLRKSNTPYGVLSVFKIDGSFDKVAQNGIDELVANVSVPLHLAISRAAATAQSTLLSKLRTINQKLLSVQEDSSELKRLITEQANELLESDLTILYEYDEREEDILVPPVFGGTLKDHAMLDIRGPRHKISLAINLLKMDGPYYASLAMEDWHLDKRTRLAHSSPTFPEREGIVSAAGIPLRAGDATLGVLFVNYRSFYPFTKEQREATVLFTQLAALALQNAKSYRYQQKYVEQLQVLNELGQRINSSQTLKVSDILPTLHEQTRKLMDARNFYVALYDEHTAQVRFKYAVKYDKRVPANDPAYAPRAGGNGLTEYVLSSRKPLLLRCNVGDWLADHSVTSFGEPCKSWLGVPLTLGDRILGMICVQSFTQVNAYDDADKNLLNTIASHVSPILARAQALNELTENQKEFELLGEATLAISTRMSIEERLDKIVGNATRLFNAQGGKVYLIDPKTGNLVLRAVTGIEPEKLLPGEILEIGQGLSGQVVLHQTPLYTNTYSQYPFHLPDHRDSFRAVIGVPLFQGADQEFIGVLSIFDTKGIRKFTDADIPKVQRFANYAALAIRDAHHRRDLQLQVNRFRVINDVTQGISTAKHLDSYFGQIVSTIKNQLDCDQCAIYIREDTEDEVFLVQKARSASQSTPPSPIRFKEDEGVIGFVYQQVEAQVFSRVTEHEAFLDLKDNPYLFRSMLAVTIRVGDKKIGIITADSMHDDTFSEADLKWVNALASNIAIGIESFNATQNQQSLSTQLLGAMTDNKRAYEAGIQTILQQIVTKAIQLVQGSSSIIYVLSEDKKTIIEKYCPPGKEHHHPTPRQDADGNFTGMTGQVLEKKEPIIISNIAQDERVTPEISQAIKSLSAFPLKVEDEVIGVLYIDHLQVRRLTAIELRFTSMLADLAALAINKYSLLSQMARTQKSARMVAGQALIQDWDKALETLMEGASTALGGDAITLHIYDSANEEFSYPPHLRGVWQPEKVYKSQETIMLDAAHYRILESDKTLHLVTDASRDKILAGDFVRREEVKSAAAIKLTVKEGDEHQVVGIMFVNYRTQKKEFSKEEEEDIQLFASLAAATIRSAQLYQKVNQIRETARQFAKDNLKVSKNLKVKLKSIATGIQKTLRCDVVSVHTYFSEDSEFATDYAEAGERVDEEKEKMPPHKPTVLFDVLKYDGLCTTDDPEFRDLLLGPFAKRQDLQAVAALPLGDPHAKVGVLFVSYRRPHRFSEEERKDIQLFGDQSAIAIRNSQLFELSERKMYQYETLLQNSPNPIVAIDEKGRIGYCNNNVEHILGYTVNQLKSKRVVDLYWDGIAEARRINDKLRQDKKVVQHETFVRHKNGDRIPILLSAAPLPANTARKYRNVSIGIIEDQRFVALKGRMKRFFDVISEINKSPDQERILTDLFERAFSLFSSCEAGAIFLRDDSSLKMVSEFQAPDRLRKQPVRPLEAGPIGVAATTCTTRYVDDLKGLDAPLFPFSEKSRSAIILPITQNNDCLGVLYLESSVSKEFNPEDDLLPLLAAQAAVAIERARYHDIQERWRQTNEEMFASSKAIVAAQIASSFLHEVKNLLNNISVNHKVFKRLIDKETEIKKKKPYYDRIKAVEKSVLQAARFANESQRFKDNLTAHLRPEYLNQVVRETLEQIGNVLKKKRLNLETNLDPSLDKQDSGKGKPVELDRDLIILVLINLIFNAIEASSERSKILVSTHHTETEAILKVTDFGKGIAAEDLDKIFKPFFTRKKDNGVGLGLFVCKTIIVEKHSGLINPESKAGKTVFSVHLPFKSSKK